MSDPQLEDLFQQIRELFAAESARIEKETISKIMQAVKGDATSAQDIKKAAAPRVRPRLTVNRRAKRGSVDMLIKRVLRERKLKGASSMEIQESALSPVEKAASYSGIRFALDRGRRKGVYRNSGGKWFLVENKTTDHDA